MPLVPVGTPTRQVADVTLRRQAPASTEAPAAVVPAAWLAGLEQAAGQRRSVRQFSNRAVSSPALLAAVDDGFRAEAALWPAERHGSVEFAVLVAAFAVDDMARGLHLVARPGTGLANAFLGQPDWLPDLRAEYAPAPAILLICGDVRATEPAHGGGYGSLLVRAASVGYAAWLSAIGSGMAGSVFGGALRPVTAAARGSHDRLRHLFTLVLGHEH